MIFTVLILATMTALVSIDSDNSTG